MIKKRFFHIVVASLIGLMLAGLISFAQIRQERSQSDVVAHNFGGRFELVDHNGQNVTHEDFEGTYRLIYFGFTYCPAICPTELQKIASALDMLGNKAEQITPIFITVDPQRDTVSVMREYVEMFHPNLVGLTGTPAQIKQAMDSYKIYAAKVQDDSMSDYTMDHSSFIYFMGPDNALYKIFKTQDTAEDIAAEIGKRI
ncbi:MAG: SCO family protein [Alphaproteobacteria bacterium]|nr:SCO family protein [Alphaproteobacteria bacterium]